MVKMSTSQLYGVEFWNRIMLLVVMPLGDNAHIETLTLFQMGGGRFSPPPPNQAFLHCSETTQDMMTKLRDFYSNLIGNQNLNVSLF